MTDTINALCPRCRAEGELELPPVGTAGPLVCPNCGCLITAVSVRNWKSAIEEKVAYMMTLQACGAIGTRKQDHSRSDADVSRDGLEAELAACLMLCPGYRQAWLRHSGPNRGCDLPTKWTGLPKPVEVKTTRHYGDTTGYLVIRPPRWTPGRMRPEYIDDCLYVLLLRTDCDGWYRLLGWATRDLLLRCGRLNPIAVRPGQRETWGVHWRRLFGPQALLRLRVTAGQRSAEAPAERVVTGKC
jgi:hypothetical protein